MSLAKAVGFKPATFYPYLNTSTPIDIAVGSYLEGADGNFYLDGGAGPVNGVVARSGYFKSTTVDNLVVNLLRNYPGSEYFKMDTENTSTSKERFEKLSGGDMDIVDRVNLTNKGELNVKQYIDFQRKLGEEKLKHRKDYEVETPFLDRNTGKPLRMLIPTFHSLDSISNLTTDKGGMMIEDGIEDKENNTADMYDGRIKKRLVDLFITWGYRYNFCYFITAHVGDKFDINQRAPSAKQNQWMNNSDKVTNAGKNFLFLPNLSYQLGGLSPLIDDKKLPLYPSGNDNPERERVEINKLNMKVLRGKNNLTGTIIPTVMSQHYGILTDLSYYEYLRDLDKDLRSGQTGVSGFTLKGYNRYSPFLPDVAYHRKSIRKLCRDDYRARRALELMHKFNWISHYWNLDGYPFHIPATIEKLMEMIEQSSTVMIDDILESREYWTYSKQEKRKYMSLMDILRLVGVSDRSVSKSVPGNYSMSDAALESELMAEVRKEQKAKQTATK